ncbi:MAG: hypothetical protein EZS28_034177, partial [Streblomastix strix]
PFPREAFDNKLKNKSISEAKYQEYLVEAAKFTTRWDQARSYNVQDTRIMIEPIDNLIKMMFKYKIDMLAMFSMSQCANAIKYSSAYDDFKMNGDYNTEDTDKPINITMPYWTAKVESYIEQDQKKNRDSSKNVTIGDYEYFKELFEKQRCYICNCKFTWKNRPTLDRINNELGHLKDNVLPCLTTFSKHDKFNGFVQDFMQQRADAKSQKNDGLATFQIADNLHAVQVDSEYCRCNNCLQAFDQTKMHVVQLDTDSLTLAISGDKNRGPEQRFDAVIKDIEFYNKNKGYFFSEDDQRKILGVHIEKQGLNCVALSPKNYIINDECGDVSLVAKGVILRQNPQTNQQTFVDNIKQGTVMKVTNTILTQKNKIMSKLSMTKNEKRNEIVNCLEQCIQSMQKTNALCKLSMDLQRVLDGLDRCDAKLDARIMGGGVYPWRTIKKKPEHYDDQVFYLREAGELPKIISKKDKKNLVCFDEVYSDRAFEMRMSLKERIEDEIHSMNSESSVENKLHNACQEYREIRDNYINQLEELVKTLE